MSNIVPTIGRRIWFWPNRINLEVFTQQDDAQALDAGVIYVHPSGNVNLLVTDHIGYSEAVIDVAILPEGEQALHSGKAQWMPYQANQAKKQAEDDGKSTAASGPNPAYQQANLDLAKAEIELTLAKAENLREQTKQSRYQRNANPETGL